MTKQQPCSEKLKTGYYMLTTKEWGNTLLFEIKETANEIQGLGLKVRKILKQDNGYIVCSAEGPGHYYEITFEDEYFYKLFNGMRRLSQKK